MPNYFSQEQLPAIINASADEIHQASVLGLMDAPMPTWDVPAVLRALIGVTLWRATQGAARTLAPNRAPRLARAAAGLIADTSPVFLQRRTFSLGLSARRVNLLVEGELKGDLPGYIRVSTRVAVEGMAAAIEQELAAVV